MRKFKYINLLKIINSNFINMNHNIKELNNNEKNDIILSKEKTNISEKEKSKIIIFYFL